MVLEHVGLLLVAQRHLHPVCAPILTPFVRDAEKRSILFILLLVAGVSAEVGAGLLHFVDEVGAVDLGGNSA